MSQSKTEVTRSGSPGANWQLSTLKSLCTKAGGRTRAGAGRAARRPGRGCRGRRARPPPSVAASRGPGAPGSRRGGRGRPGPHARRVDQVQVGERVDHGEPDPAAGVRSDRELIRHVVPDHDAGAVLRDQEVGADDRLVGAVVQAQRRPRVRRVQPRQHGVLAAHVVRPGRDHAERRSADDQGVLAEPDQVGQVRRAVGELQHREVALDLRQVLRAGGLERGPVELLPRPHRGDLGPVDGVIRQVTHQLAHQRPSSSATSARCARAGPKTASSPSARRR